jgi:hypothetical protein
MAGRHRFFSKATESDAKMIGRDPEEGELVDAAQPSDRPVELTATQAVDFSISQLGRAMELVRRANLTPSDFPVFKRFEILDVARELFVRAGVSQETLIQTRGTPLSQDDSIARIIVGAFGGSRRKKRATLALESDAEPITSGRADSGAQLTLANFLRSASAVCNGSRTHNPHRFSSTWRRRRQDGPLINSVRFWSAVCCV